MNILKIVSLHGHYSRENSKTWLEPIIMRKGEHEY